MSLCIGLMSGTSLDGVDGVVVEWTPPSSQSDGKLGLQVRSHVHRPYEADLRAELLALNRRDGRDELHRAWLAANGVARAYAEVVTELLERSGCGAEAIHAIGAHGQTVRHQPGRYDGCGYSIQLLQGSLLAELTGIDVVCDFRSRDVAAGGQGAPLVPAFHKALFADPRHAVAVLNIGGIANLTLIPPAGPWSSEPGQAGSTKTLAGRAEGPSPQQAVRPAPDDATRGFDCGPGNALMDAWCRHHLGQDWDEQGRWASQGQVLQPLLARMLEEPFFQQAPPKSTGRDLFHTDWLAGMLKALGGEPKPVDVQATLAELTARSAAEALRQHQPDGRRLLICGGGARNTHLMTRLQALLPDTQVQTTEAAAGVPVDQVEALAFAWLAEAFKSGWPGNLPAVTGARGLRRLGALYPAN